MWCCCGRCWICFFINPNHIQIQHIHLKRIYCVSGANRTIYFCIIVCITKAKNKNRKISYYAKAKKKKKIQNKTKHMNSTKTDHPLNREESIYFPVLFLRYLDHFLSFFVYYIVSSLSILHLFVVCGFWRAWKDYQCLFQFLFIFFRVAVEIAHVHLYDSMKQRIKPSKIKQKITYGNDYLFIYILLML